MLCINYELFIVAGGEGLWLAGEEGGWQCIGADMTLPRQVSVQGAAFLEFKGTLRDERFLFLHQVTLFLCPDSVCLVCPFKLSCTFSRYNTNNCSLSFSQRFHLSDGSVLHPDPWNAQLWTYKEFSAPTSLNNLSVATSLLQLPICSSSFSRI